MKNVDELLHEFRHETIVKMAKELEDSINGIYFTSKSSIQVYVESIIKEGYPRVIAYGLAENAIKSYALSFLVTNEGVANVNLSKSYVWYEHVFKCNDCGSDKIEIESEDRIARNYYVFCMDCHRAGNTAISQGLHDSDEDLTKRAVANWNEANE